jgi:hypothetical protein
MLSQSTDAKTLGGEVDGLVYFARDWRPDGILQQKRHGMSRNHNSGETEDGSQAGGHNEVLSLYWPQF